LEERVVPVEPVATALAMLPDEMAVAPSREGTEPAPAGSDCQMGSPAGDALAPAEVAGDTPVEAPASDPVEAAGAAASIDTSDIAGTTIATAAVGTGVTPGEATGPLRAETSCQIGSPENPPPLGAATRSERAREGPDSARNDPPPPVADPDPAIPRDPHPLPAGPSRIPAAVSAIGRLHAALLKAQALVPRVEMSLDEAERYHREFFRTVLAETLPGSSGAVEEGRSIPRGPP
jgi:hypothetical protein